MSLSSRRAWIEIPFDFSPSVGSGSRSPHGERGLKFDNCMGSGTTAVSLSSRRAWIEIARVALKVFVARSLSSRRAWIEINIVNEELERLKRSLSSRRAWIEISKSIRLPPSGRSSSLSSRRAWIEIKLMPRATPRNIMSLSSRRAWIEIRITMVEK